MFRIECIVSLHDIAKDYSMLLGIFFTRMSERSCLFDSNIGSRILQGVGQAVLEFLVG